MQGIQLRSQQQVFVITELSFHPQLLLKWMFRFKKIKIMIFLVELQLDCSEIMVHLDFKV